MYLHGDHSLVPRDRLGSVSLATDDEGHLLSQARYNPYGQVRWNGDTLMPTKFAFTGQRQDGFGLMDYNARFYSPKLGRFVSADSIIPNAMSPQAFDRFAYVLNNPVKYVDPTGHINGQQPLTNQTCGPDSVACGGLADPHNESEVSDYQIAGMNYQLALGEITPEEYYDWLVDNGYFTIPSASDVRNPEDRPLDDIQATINYYVDIRKNLFLLYGWKYVDITGKIDDQVLMALIIMGEYGNKQGAAYDEILEAVSNQYHSTSTISNIQCGLDGCTLIEQLMWLSDVESWYYGVIFANQNNWGAYYEDAGKAAAGYCYGANCNSWMWGNVPLDTNFINFNGRKYYQRSSQWMNALSVEPTLELYRGEWTYFIVWESPGMPVP